jgi:DNA-binding response OmpR family regulator
MKRNALVMCRNQRSIDLVTAALHEIHVGVEVCGSSADASDLLLRIPYAAVVLDFDLPDAPRVAAMVRGFTGKRKPILFAMIGALTPVGGAVQGGANFVLYKPFEPEQISYCFRAASRLMKADRRGAPRHKLSVLAYLHWGAVEVPVLILDVSEQGVALQAGEMLPAAGEVSLRFILPETEILIETTGQMIWSEGNGRAAMFFTRMNPASRKQINGWLEKRRVKKSEAVRVLLPPPRERHSQRAAH